MVSSRGRESIFTLFAGEVNLDMKIDWGRRREESGVVNEVFREDDDIWGGDGNGYEPATRTSRQE